MTAVAPASLLHPPRRPLSLIAAVLALALAGGCTAYLHQEAPAAALALAPAPAPVSTGLEEGRAEYLLSCASCHGVDARGDGPAAAALRVPPSDLTALTADGGGEFPRDYVIAVIAGEHAITAHGNREMPVWRQRFDLDASGGPAVASIYARRRLEMLASYLESLQREDPEVQPPDDRSRDVP